MGRSRYCVWIVGTGFAVSLLNLADSPQLYNRLFAEDRAIGLKVNVTAIVDSEQPDAENAPAKPDQPAETPPPAADPAAAKADPDVKAPAENAPSDNVADTKLRTLKESVAKELRQVASVCGAVVGEVTDEAFEVTVLVEESAKKQPSVEELTTKIRRLCGEREVKLETKPWAAAARLKQLQGVVKSQADLQDVKLGSLFLLGLTPDKLACQLQGSAKNPNAQDALVVAVTALVTEEFESPAGKPNSVDAQLDVTFDPEPLLKAIQKSLAQNADLSGVRIERVIPHKDPEKSLWKLELKGDSPLPLKDDAELVKLVNELLPSVYPQWTDKLEPQTPVLADRVPDAAPVLAGVKKLLKDSQEWKSCELAQIVVAPQTEPGKLVNWTLKGKAAQPLQESQLIELCGEVIEQANPWWKRAKERLDIKSACALEYPSPEPFVAHIQSLLKSAPEWRGCVLKRIEPSAAGGGANADAGGPVVMIWTLVGDVYHPGQKERLMALVQEEHCRLHPAWKNYAGLQFEEQLKQAPVDPAPVLKALQAKLGKYSGWTACTVTGLESPPCSSNQADKQTWEIIGTVAFMAQQVELPDLVGEAFQEVYPGWGESTPPRIDPNRVKIVHPTAATLLALLQHDMERMPEYDDCHILDAELETGMSAAQSAERVHLKLIGRTTGVAHQNTLVSLEQFPSLKKHYGKKITLGDDAQIAPNPSDVEIMPISPGLASLQFEIGQNHYVHCEFAQAKAAFVGAMFDDVSNLNYKLWHVAMCLACGDESLAHDRLYNILRGHRPEYRNSDAFRSAMRSLERLQGPLRNQLEELERQVLSEIAIKTAQGR